MRIRSRLLVAAVLAVSTLVGCGGSTTVDRTTAPVASSTAPEGGGASVMLDGVRTVTPQEAGALVAGRAVVIDVRTAEEFAAVHVKGAINLNVENGDLDAELPKLAKDARYVVYCHSGRRSGIAAARMKAAGFAHVGDAGGLETLIAAGIPTA